MPQVINTNIASLNAQRNLNESQRDANVAFERLSSGLRINSAKDDAAGLAISTRFQSQISGLNVAQRNASDGISLAQTTEGALSEVINNLQRIRDLAVQSANATNSASDRLALDQEVQQRIGEIARIADQTTFNGLKVLDGSFGEKTFQVGANSGDTIGVDLSKGSRADQIGSLATSGSRQVSNQPLADGDLTISVGDSDTFEIPGTGTDSSAKAKAEAIEQANIPGLPTVTATNVQDLAFSAVDGATGSTAGTGTYTIELAIGTTTETITANLDAPTGSTGATADTLTSSELATAINDAGIEGLSAAGSSTGVELTDSMGRNITITSESKTVITNTTTDPATAATSDLAGGSAGFLAGDVGAVGTATKYGQISLEALDTISIGGNNPGKVGFVADETIAVSGNLESVNIKTVDGANDAIKRVDSALDTINGIRSELGAIQNRFESTIANLSTTSENLSAANSRIRDADFAAETAELARTQVLQQAGLSVLSQANGRPQQVLQLLQG
ncbi:flagellin N-terminal helical domain-containing protein [Marinobacter persicus]|uniref:Flagellin n=1 Tax=Marinobacter persicus TaxID=930118 RepID=A0A2S6G601_9GAMM|nr:flagellin [Marinobacter persicus]PPK51316.1 flagellin [Marinobacter persicus]PPK54569.1 flagellin [Marinobacter persicus]PPK57995.1 flagellin [Marinobacter persicus]